MNCEGCYCKKPMSKLTVKGEGWGEKWLCDKCVEERWDEEKSCLKPIERKPRLCR